MTEKPEKIKDLFARPPTRELEEVEKVNSKQHAEKDVREFCETDSTKKVLSKLGDLVNRGPEKNTRFMYIHATFGSGKTLLLKLIGFAVGEDEDTKHLASKLSDRYSGFNVFRKQLSDSHIDHLVPIFLNLLGRDTTQEPPIPLLIYQRLGNRLSYPIDPRWLLEWVWRLDIQYDLWEELKEFRYDGKTFKEVLEERASLRGWLYKALPEMPGTNNTPYGTREGVRKSIEEAEEYINPRNFTPKKLRKRIQETISYLEEGTGETYEFLIGLDEVALFIYNNHHRYREFQRTVEALFKSPSLIIATGQWSLSKLHKNLTGETEGKDWFNEVKLQAADTEVIARERWLQKDIDEKKYIKNLLQNSEKWELTFFDESITKDLEKDPVGSYPFRDSDLWLLRRVMENLITRGRPTEHEYIQGRALLVLVRSLFTTFGWSTREVGDLVPWDIIYDLLIEETTLVPTWVQEKIETWETTFGQDSMEERVAKVLYLVNQAEDVPSTSLNMAKLLISQVDEDLESLHKEVKQALGKLEKYIHDEKREGHHIYQLLSEESFTVAEEINEKIGDIPTYMLNARVRKLLKDTSNLLMVEKTRQKVTIKNERNIPLVFRYSIFEEFPVNPKHRFDTLVIRVLVGESERLSKEISQWRKINKSEEGLEDLLIVIEFPEGFKQRLRWLIASERVLSKKSGSYRELVGRQSGEQRRLEKKINEQLDEARVYVTRKGSSLGRFEEIFEDSVIDEVEKKFPNRKTLLKPLREIDDARAMFKFFQEETASWPLEERDADMIGVDTINHKIENGWAGDFLEEWGDESLVTGEELLEEIENRNGRYLGTPLESLAALLLCLAAANKVGLKKEGEPILDPSNMGRAVRTKENIKNLEIKPGAKYSYKEVARFKDIFKFICGFPPKESDPAVILDNLKSWVQKNSMILKRVDRRLNREFSEKITIGSLISVLEPAMKGEKLSERELLRDPVPEQAGLFSKTKQILITEKGHSLWNKFKNKTEKMESMYPDEPITREMQEKISGEHIPEQQELKSILKKARSFRLKKLKRIYRQITGEETKKEELIRICNALANWIVENKAEINDLMNRIRTEFSKLQLSKLDNIIKAALETELKEQMLILPEVRRQARAFKRARKLLEEGIHTQLKERVRELRQEHPDSPITNKLQRLVSGQCLTTVKQAKKLLKESEIPEEEQSKVSFERIWSKITQLEEGSLVLIDKGEDSK